jgi:hypothetical protein
MLGPRSFTTKCCMEAECLPSVLLGIRGCQVYQCPICGTSHDKMYGQALSQCSLTLEDMKKCGRRNVGEVFTPNAS